MSFRHPVAVHINETPGRLFIAAVFDFNGGQFPRFRIVDDQIHLSLAGTAPEVHLPREIPSSLEPDVLGLSCTETSGLKLGITYPDYIKIVGCNKQNR